MRYAETLDLSSSPTISKFCFVHDPEQQVGNVAFLARPGRLHPDGTVSQYERERAGTSGNRFITTFAL